MSEQVSSVTSAQETTTGACAHPEAIGKRWADPIDEELQLDLQNYLDQWAEESNHGDRLGPFQKVTLSGAEVYWLAERVRNEQGDVPDLHLEGAFLRGVHLEGANLSHAHLEHTDLIVAYLAGANLRYAHLEHADLARAHLEHANLSGAYLEATNLDSALLETANLGGAGLERANLRAAHLEGALLDLARCERANLVRAHLENANLYEADLRGANLSGAHEEGVNLTAAKLSGADLRGASFDKASLLNSAVLTGASFDQVIFDNTNLTVVDWSLVTTLGDERTARERKAADGKPEIRAVRLEQFKAAVRANRVLSVNLQAQGLAEDGDRFAYRAKKLQRSVLWYQRKPGAYLFSWLLAGLAGYGYSLRRIFVVYGLAVLLFAAGYFLAGGVTPQAHLSLQQQALDALQVSLNAIHGRVFFTQLGLDTLQSWLATLESIVGIVIEGVFVAMLIQRFVAR